MIRGAQKRMIVIRTHDSRVFEEAYFVMRRDSEMAVNDGDMLSEADRIIRRSMVGFEDQEKVGSKRRMSTKLRCFIWFLSGMIMGSGCIGMLWFLL